MAREQVQTLTEPMFYILLALLEERCGVDIMEKVDELSGGRISVGPGTLYNLLPKLEKSGFIERTREEGRQKWYVISVSGQELLQKEISRMKRQLMDYERLF